jgi:hypothetical protein
MIKAEHCHTCPFIFKLLNSCPNLFLLETGTHQEIFIEFFLATMSAAAYLAFFGTFAFSIMKKTSRGFCLAVAIMIQVCACELFKFVEKQARPAGACADSFGFPSSHSSFVGTLFTWLVLEWIFLDANAPFKMWKGYKFWRNLGILYSPIVPYSRSHLNYHTIEQIYVGLISGALFAAVFFVYVYFFVIYTAERKESPLVRFWRKYGYYDNLVFKKTDPKTREQIKELQEKYNLIHNVKTDLLKQKDALKARLNKMEDQYNNNNISKKVQ